MTDVAPLCQRPLRPHTKLDGPREKIADLHYLSLCPDMKNCPRKDLHVATLQQEKTVTKRPYIQPNTRKPRPDPGVRLTREIVDQHTLIHFDKELFNSEQILQGPRMVVRQYIRKEITVRHMPVTKPILIRPRHSVQHIRNMTHARAIDEGGDDMDAASQDESEEMRNTMANIIPLIPSNTITIDGQNVIDNSQVAFFSGDDQDFLELEPLVTPQDSDKDPKISMTNKASRNKNRGPNFRHAYEERVTSGTIADDSEVEADNPYMARPSILILNSSISYKEAEPRAYVFPTQKKIRVDLRRNPDMDYSLNYTGTSDHEEPIPTDEIGKPEKGRTLNIGYEGTEVNKFEQMQHEAARTSQERKINAARFKKTTDQRKNLPVMDTHQLLMPANSQHTTFCAECGELQPNPTTVCQCEPSYDYNQLMIAQSDFFLRQMIFNAMTQRPKSITEVQNRLYCNIRVQCLMDWNENKLILGVAMSFWEAAIQRKELDNSTLLYHLSADGHQGNSMTGFPIIVEQTAVGRFEKENLVIHASVRNVQPYHAPALLAKDYEARMIVAHKAAQEFQLIRTSQGNASEADEAKVKWDEYNDHVKKLETPTPKGDGWPADIKASLDYLNQKTHKLVWCNQLPDNFENPTKDQDGRTVEDLYEMNDKCTHASRMDMINDIHEAISINSSVIVYHSGKEPEKAIFYNWRDYPAIDVSAMIGYKIIMLKAQDFKNDQSSFQVQLVDIVEAMSIKTFTVEEAWDVLKHFKHPCYVNKTIKASHFNMKSTFRATITVEMYCISYLFTRRFRQVIDTYTTIYTLPRFRHMWINRARQAETAGIARMNPKAGLERRTRTAVMNYPHCLDICDHEKPKLATSKRRVDPLDTIKKRKRAQATSVTKKRQASTIAQATTSAAAPPAPRIVAPAPAPLPVVPIV
jgi:hypothetical protein